MAIQLAKALAEWNMIKNGGKLQKDSFPQFQRSAWIEMFLKYNSSIPSSAAVERVFSTGSDILRPKRSSLTGHNFERLLMIKENKVYVKKDLL